MIFRNCSFGWHESTTSRRSRVLLAAPGGSWVTCGQLASRRSCLVSPINILKNRIQGHAGIISRTHCIIVSFISDPLRIRYGSKLGFFLVSCIVLTWGSLVSLTRVELIVARLCTQGRSAVSAGRGYSRRQHVIGIDGL